MIELKFSKEELNVLLFAINSMSLHEEEDYEKQGVSISSLYNKIYSAWELAPLTNS